MKRRLRMLFFLDYDDGAGGRFVNSPGLLPLIGYTRSAGFDVQFVVTVDELLAALQSPTVDVVGISSMERLLPRSIAVARKIRKCRPDVILMIGGNAIDPFAVDLAAGMFDIVALGESEHILPALLRAIAHAKALYVDGDVDDDVRFIDGARRRVGEAYPGGALDEACINHLFRASFVRSMPGLGRVQIRVGNVYLRDPQRNTVWYLEEPGRSTQSPEEALLAIEPGRGSDRPAEHVANLLSSVPLDGELDDLCVLPWGVLAAEGWKHFEFYTQRGCRWGQCNFCSVADRKIRALSPSKVADVIEGAVARGVEMISFADDLFVQHRDWNQELFQHLLDRNIRTTFRAQTMANRMVWPLLDPMYRVGFVELAFGVETLSPARAEFMAKSFNGQKYVENAKETVRQTAAAGIHPVLYMILVDPASTLRQIAEELYETVTFVDWIYRSTNVVPKLSYSLMMLPVACTSLTARFEYSVETVPLQVGQLQLPTEFKVSPAVSTYLAWIARQTNDIPFRRENLSSLISYLEGVEMVAQEFKDPHLQEIRRFSGAGLEALHDLMHRLDGDVEHTAGAMFDHITSGSIGLDITRGRFDYRRFGGYITGIQQLSKLLSAGLQSTVPA